MNPQRAMQLALALGLSLYFSLVCLNNLLDWSSNFAFVEHVLSMDTILPESSLAWRSITSPFLHHLCYGFIIAVEGLIAGLCLGGWRAMVHTARSPSRDFKQAKHLLLWGLVSAYTLWFIGFVAIGSEWFAMWQSKIWNGKSTAMDITLVCLGSFLIISLD